MRDYIKRFLIAIIMALCVSLLFLGGKHSQAASLDEMKELQEHWIWPADGVISDTYGTRQGKHKGIDIAGKMDTPILAVDDGIVIKSYFSNTYGNVVFIKHPSKVVTVYAHLTRRNVNVGQNIKQGDMVGKMGQTGQATGTHLHFETHELEWRYDKKYAIDPEMLLGKADVGEFVQGGVAASGYNVLEASSHVKSSTKGRSIQAKANKYVVQQGDTLYAISKKRNMSVKRLKDINHLHSDVIKPKQILLIE
ncbi:peptidoglycan DD-metalloendopeptidase family protein [Paenibacillus sp. BSR1-1]|uniref:peptidoglycan DD-metalloendopeptidase family protein n=1 Tax=Paenibacillus sp. BSR1-1 TaxID=3020845 RepID=UPI0025AF17BB|nr:peptidoglycan DD-metalloendopeptidase family protein [Paenibacillus sp. BSR1-1]MDN3016665.1 peptidoglycan DD-metalloendopeptidase family protein [Paenibacillus sp. BSR1-1]